MSEIDRIIEKCIADELPPCQAACPLHVDVKGYTGLIAQGKFGDALKLIRDKLPFPGVMGRICTRPCEEKCKRAEVDQAIAIDALKRCAADYGGEVGWEPGTIEDRAERIAIVGSGPAGLMAAYDMRKLGYQVTIFEVLPHAGGMMRVGIPEYRLPRYILEEEIGIVEKLGVRIKLSAPIGGELTLTDLRKDFSAIFIAIGAHVSTKLGVPGEDLPGVHSGLDFLREVNSGKGGVVGGKVVVVGGGDAAIDAARVAYRLGAKEVSIVYRRSRAEMPASSAEIEAAESEGINIIYLANPTGMVAQDGKVKTIECLRMKLGEPDENGRRRPISIPGSKFFIEADLVIPALGQLPDVSFMDKDMMLRLNPGGTLQVDPLTLQTNVAGIFAGGDVVTGPGTVIDALAAGRKAAISIDRYLNGQDLTVGRDGEGARESRLVVNIEGVAKKEKVAVPTLPVAERMGNFREVELALSEEDAKEEAKRCLSCECRRCVRECLFLQQSCELPKELAQRFELGYFKEKPEVPYSCNLCGLCQEVCPEELNVGNMCLQLRQQLVAEGLGPLKQHKYVYWNLDWSTSESFALAQPDPQTAECKRVFFPGCNLSGYSPPLVLKAYDYLRERLPGTGIVLYCCGTPVRDLGQHARFEEVVNAAQAQVEKLGASEVIVACPNCYKSFKYHAPRLKVRSLYEIMVELGLPDKVPTQKRTFAIHDSCPTRWENDIQESVRVLVRKMGYEIEEMAHSREKTHCCGMGGMVAYVDIMLSFEVTKLRADETRHDIITYCAGCREAFASPDGAEKPALHILDLIFNPDWEQARLEPPRIGKQRRENQALVKSQLMNTTLRKKG